MKSLAVFCVALIMTFATVACSQKSSNVSYKDSVQKALEQADLKDVKVSEDNDKNTITLSGTLHSADAKQQAGQVAQAAAGNRIVANEIGIEPVGVESEAKDIASNVDSAIEKNYKASLIAQGLDKQNIDYSAKNGVLTLTGKVKTAKQRTLAEQTAANVPNVNQVLNQIEVR
jgi:osmotically-inducible protein OsmY